LLILQREEKRFHSNLTVEIAYCWYYAEAERVESDKSVISLLGLVRIKLQSNRDQDRVHLRDLIDVGLVDRGFLKGVPVELGSRLEVLLGEYGK
jgi:hypothetical protein